MAKRDPKKTARNKKAEELSVELRGIQAQVLDLTGLDNIQQLNAKIGGKLEVFVGIKSRHIRSADELISLYLDELRSRVLQVDPAGRHSSAVCELAHWYQKFDLFRKYFELFLQRTFLRKFDEINRAKPNSEDATIWFGSNGADYGLLVCPRYNESEGLWKNDKSEIRRLKKPYFSIGHVLEVGLAFPGTDEIMNFDSIDSLMKFYKHSLVRQTKSKHQIAIAELYEDYVRDAADPQSIPFLIPELRYEGLARKHKYRLDFCIIDPFTFKKIGFELSPWSSHGYIAGTKKKTTAEVNSEARGNFEKEVKKQRKFFLNRGVTVLIFSDTDLESSERVFDDIQRYLSPEPPQNQLLLMSKKNLIGTDIYSEVLE